MRYDIAIRLTIAPQNAPYAEISMYLYFNFNLQSITFELHLGTSIPSVNIPIVGPKPTPPSAIDNAKIPPNRSTINTKQTHIVPVTTTINFRMLLAVFSEVLGEINLAMKSL